MRTCNQADEVLCILMNLDAVWPFYAGVFLQSVFLLIGRFEQNDIVKLLGCCAGSCVGLIPGKHEDHYNPSFHLLAIAGVFSVMYVALFKEKILQRINKELLMVWTLIGFYVALQTRLITDSPAAITVLAVLSVIPVINAFAGFDKGFGWKVYFYMWFLVVLVFVAASKFAYSTVANIFGLNHSDTAVNSFTAFCVGMSFLYLAANLWYLIKLCPMVKSGNQTFSERMNEVEEEMETLASEYDDEQVRWWKSVLLLAVCGFLLAANYFRHYVSDETLIPFLIVLLPVVDKIKLPSKGPVQTMATTDPPINTGE
jgi:hypothetical protein